MSPHIHLRCPINSKVQIHFLSRYVQRGHVLPKMHAEADHNDALVHSSGPTRINNHVGYLSSARDVNHHRYILFEAHKQPFIFVY